MADWPSQPRAPNNRPRASIRPFHQKQMNPYFSGMMGNRMIGPSPIHPNPPMTFIPPSVPIIAPSAPIPPLFAPPMVPAKKEEKDEGDDNAWLSLLNPYQAATLNNLKSQQDEFEEHYQNWLKEFDIWRENNASHPDSKSFKEYAQQWEQWKDKLLSKKEQMQKLLTQTMEQLKSQVMQQLQNPYGQFYHPGIVTFPPLVTQYPLSQPITQPPSQSGVSVTSFGLQTVPPPQPTVFGTGLQSRGQGSLPPTPSTLAASSVPQPVPPPDPLLNPSLTTISASAVPPPPPVPPPSVDLPQLTITNFDKNSIPLPPEPLAKSSDSEFNASQKDQIDVKTEQEDSSKKNLDLNDEEEAFKRLKQRIDSSTLINFGRSKSSSPEVQETSTKAIAKVESDNQVQNIHSSTGITSQSYSKRKTLEAPEKESKISDPASRNLTGSLKESGKRSDNIGETVNANKIRKTSGSESDSEESDVHIGEIVQSVEEGKPFDFEGVMSQMKSIKANSSNTSSGPLFPSCQVPEERQEKSKSIDRPFQVTNIEPVIEDSLRAKPLTQFYESRNQYVNLAQSDSTLLNSLSNRSGSVNIIDTRPHPIDRVSNNHHGSLSQMHSWSRVDRSNQRNVMDTLNRINPSPIHKGSMHERAQYLAKTIDYEHGGHPKSIRQPLFPDTPFLTSNEMHVPLSRLARLPIIPPHFMEQKRAPPIKLTYKDENYFLRPPSEIVDLNDLIFSPAREYRPKKIAIILRGLPGSGKTHLAKLIKDKELENSGSAPRILSLDDYFMVEKDGSFVYEYEQELEKSYRGFLLKALRRTVDDGYFHFIIIDSVNELISHFEDFYNYALKKGFVVYICEMNCTDTNICFKQNVHKRSLDDIRELKRKWEKTPKDILRLDCSKFLKSISLDQVDSKPRHESEVEAVENDKSKKEFSLSYLDQKEIEEKNVASGSNPSKDELDDTNRNLSKTISRWEKMEENGPYYNRLDDFKMKPRMTMEEYLQLPDDFDDYYNPSGPKRVRWADIEERKNQQRLRNRGFVVGQDWDRIMNPNHPEKALNRTKYF